jgi:hypothetical protein
VWKGKTHSTFERKNQFKTHDANDANLNYIPIFFVSAFPSGSFVFSLASFFLHLSNWKAIEQDK